MDQAERQADVETAPRPAYGGTIVVLLALAVGAVAGVACFAANMGADEGIWNCLRRAWVHYDQAPYRDIVDDKTQGAPGSYYGTRTVRTNCRRGWQTSSNQCPADNTSACLINSDTPSLREGTRTSKVIGGSDVCENRLGRSYE